MPALRFLFRPLFVAGFVLAFQGWISLEADAQKPLYDEAKLPDYQLPEILIDQSGRPIRNKQEWVQSRRPEILQAFKDHVFGTMPDPDRDTVVLSSESTRSTLYAFKLDRGLPTEREVEGRVRQIVLKLGTEQESKSELNVLIISPSNQQRSPAFLAYNFSGNATISDCPDVQLGEVWNSKQRKMVPVAAKSRGSKQSRWPVALILDRGYSLVTLYNGDVDPDFDDQFKNGVHRLFPDLQGRQDNWATIGAWAWGLHRVMDYLETDALIDEKKVIVFGHSRLGKTSLWTGATDERIAAVIANNSGCGGAALSRRRFGESVKRINTVFPHWFTKKHCDYNLNENACPVDHHMLIALIAPRPVYIASAAEDRWADPKGEYLATAWAGQAYELFGKQVLVPTDQLSKTLALPPLEQPMGTDVRYHIRKGRHDVKRYDWLQYLNFADETVNIQ